MLLAMAPVFDAACVATLAVVVILTNGDAMFETVLKIVSVAFVVVILTYSDELASALGLAAPTLRCSLISIVR